MSELIPPSQDQEPTSVVERIVALATQDHSAWNLLATLTDGIGPRLSGSPQAEAAIAWGEAAFEAHGIRAWREPVTVPHWVRGEASARITSGLGQSIALFALGGSVATPAEGLEAEVVQVRSLEEIDELGETLSGKIVLINRAMDLDLVRTQRAFDAYRDVAPLRHHGASRAARHGAVALLIRSLGSASWRLPHAGGQGYADDVPRIPAAAIAAEDAELIGRLIERGEPVRVSLSMNPQTLPDVDSSNVVAEVPGREDGEELVLIGAHLDCWDVSPGAHDNGSGVVMVIQTLRLLSIAGLRPRRTVRGVLFMNEENGARGGIAYHTAHKHEPFIAVAETDHGAFEPIGFDTTLTDDRSRQFAPLIEALEANGVFASLAGRPARIVQQAQTGVDTARFVAGGVPGFGLMPDSRHYFDLHHTAADTLDKVDPAALARCVAAFASLVWTLAEQGV